MYVSHSVYTYVYKSSEYQNQNFIMDFVSPYYYIVRQDGLLSSLPYAVELGVLLTAGIISDYLINGGHLSRTNTRQLFKTTGNNILLILSLIFTTNTPVGELFAVNVYGSEWCNGLGIFSRITPRIQAMKGVINDMEWYDMIYDVIYDMIWHEMRYDTIRYDMIYMMWYMIWCDRTEQPIIWYSMKYIIWYTIRFQS